MSLIPTPEFDEKWNRLLEKIKTELESKNVSLKSIADENGENELPLHELIIHNTIGGIKWGIKEGYEVEEPTQKKINVIFSQLD